ncbi:alpha/beta hydrolase [Colwellia sp. Arc7-635]|uniref:alpha/beta hydrolase n=1 Tax=Colwellia sp. Arc7-635 TaxID=2497879 RepID=UPI000F855933|nr:alpha/beta hydrolase [Colwellia sp. Arc7-635]AZQ83532.1 alpha/beta hydrolase [Colwellia sp. Arc7-635]
MRGKVSKNLMPLLNQVNAGLEQAKASGLAFQPNVIRQNLENLSAYMIPGPEVSLIQDIVITMPKHAIKARIYHPAPDKALPVLLHFHGGGHMCGSVNLYDPISRELAIATEAIVICIDYRLAPEHPYPCGLEDCQYLLENYQSILKGYLYSDQLYIAGDSAGGAICTSLVLNNINNINNINNPKIDINKQILLYPSVDYTMSSPSIVENGQGFLLEADKIDWYFKQYFNVAENTTNEELSTSTLINNASPLLGTFNSDMPKTLVITAGCDPLRDEGVLYAEKAKQAGTDVTHYQFDDLIHAYMLLSKLIPEQYQQTYHVIRDFINND